MSRYDSIIQAVYLSSLQSVLSSRRSLSLINHRRSFYDPKCEQALPAYKIKVWPGYSTAIDQFEGGVYLQCDISHRILRTETVRDLLSARGQQF